MLLYVSLEIQSSAEDRTSLAELELKSPQPSVGFCPVRMSQP